MFELTTYGGIRPFSSFDIFKEMEALENQFFGRQLPAFRTDIKENDEGFVLEAELPGFAKDEIKLELRDNILTISAEHKSESEDTADGGKYLRRERSYGSFRRAFNLKGIDVESIRASHKDGVLTLTLPREKAKESNTRTLTIE